MSEKASWEWFGNAAHLIVGSSCRYHLATRVGKYIVSTVGEYWPERSSREITARVRDPKWFEANKHLLGDTFDSAYMLKFGYDTIGCDRKYETMVFKIVGKGQCSCGCGLPNVDFSELAFAAANDAKTAGRNHRKLCARWAKK